MEPSGACPSCARYWNVNQISILTQNVLQRIVISSVTDNVSLFLSSRPRNEGRQKDSKFLRQSQLIQTKLLMLPCVFYNR